MSSVVIPFPRTQPPSTEVAQYVRIGSAHKSFGDLHAEGFLPLKRVVVEASRIARQADLLRHLKSEGTEVVLDTEAAELSSIYRFKTNVRNAPWLDAPPTQPLVAAYFTQERIDAIARLAVQYAVNSILAPTHYLGDPNYGDWLRQDLESCNMLRRSLDREGGTGIAIDYPVLHTAAGLADTEQRKMLLEGLAQMPIEQVWVRVSGLGKDAGPQKTRALIRQLAGLHNLGRPIVLDYNSGLNAQTAVAFGAASGVSFGIMELDHFDASNWHKPMKEKDPETSYGRATYISVPGLGRSFERKEFELLAQARGGRRVLLQNDHSSTTSIEEMVRDRKAHAALHTVRSYEQIEHVPDLNRAQFFLDGPVKDMERRARDVSRLRPTQGAADALGVDLASLLRRTSDHHVSLEKVAIALEKLHEERGQGATMPEARGKSRWNTKR